MKRIPLYSGRRRSGGATSLGAPQRAGTEAVAVSDKTRAQAEPSRSQQRPAPARSQVPAGAWRRPTRSKPAAAVKAEPKLPTGAPTASAHRRLGRSLSLAIGSVLGAAVLILWQAVAPDSWGGNLLGSRSAHDQDRIDAAVAESLHTMTLPSMAARAAAVLSPSVVRVRSFGPPEDGDAAARDPSKPDPAAPESFKPDGANQNGAKPDVPASPDLQRLPPSLPDFLRPEPLPPNRSERSADGRGLAAPNPPARSEANRRQRPNAATEWVQNGVGTGVVIKDDGLILSNLHVVASARRISVVFADGSETEAVITGARPEHDLAVLRPKTVPDDVQPAVLRSTGDLKEGDAVIVVGFPFDIGPSVSSGVISGFNREYRSTSGERVLTNLVQFDAAANPGNSGGPLATMDGEVIGIVTAILNPNAQRSFVGIGFAVPIENAAAAAGLPPH